MGEGGRELIKQEEGVGILIQIFRFAGVDKWRPVDFLLNHAAREEV